MADSCPAFCLSRSRPVAWLAGFLGGFAAFASAQESPATPTEGAIAAQDYVAPADLAVVDAVATAATAAAAGENLPIVVRPDPAAADAVVAEFDAAFRSTRAAYLDALHAAFEMRTVGSREINSSRFRSFRSEFQAGNPLFPVNLVLAQTWAKGYDGEPTRERLAQALRATMMARPIGNLRPASTVFVAALEPSARIRTWGEASPHARAMNRSEIISVETAGQDLRQSLDILDRGAGGFMTGLLRPSVVEDPYLTGLLLHERLGDKIQVRNFRRGEPIVRRGAIIDRTSALALTQLTRMGLEPQTALSTPTLPMTPDRPTTAASPTTAPVASERAHSRWPWVYIVIAGTGAVLVLAAIALRRAPRRAIPSASSSARWLDQSSVTSVIGVRQALIPHLARELKNRLVQALFAQRQALLHNEAAASQRVADLEERLAKLQPAIAEKIRGYEKRIQVLEAELEEKDQETRDLIRAKLVLARKELDAEITRHRVDWN